MFHPLNTITAYKGQVIYDTPATEAKAADTVAASELAACPGVTPPTAIRTVACPT